MRPVTRRRNISHPRVSINLQPHSGPVSVGRRPLDATLVVEEAVNSGVEGYLRTRALNVTECYTKSKNGLGCNPPAARARQRRPSSNPKPKRRNEPNLPFVSNKNKPESRAAVEDIADIRVNRPTTRDS